VYKIDKDEKVDNKIYDRTFFPSETGELIIYGLKGRDSLVVKSDGSGNNILIRFIGGGGDDIVNTEAAKNRMLVYDSKEDNTISKGQSTRLRLSDKQRMNDYDRDAFDYDTRKFTPYFDYNGDDGVFLGGGFTIRTHGFRKYPFASEQQVDGNYAPKSGAYTLRYRSAFYSLFGQNSDLLVTARWNGPKYTFNYYGEGNSTGNPGNDNLYYRIRTKNFSATAFLQHRFSGDALKIGIGPGYEYYRVEQPGNRYVSSPAFPDKKDIAAPGNFATMRAFADIEVVDNPVFPGSGIRWKSNADLFYELGGAGYRFLQLRSALSFYMTPNFSLPITAAFRVGGASNIGNYRFYQANTLGHNTFLRGYRNSRFAGRSMIFENSELRFRLSTLRNYIFTGHLGIFGFFDSGRVYADLPERPAWHSGYGPGLWINLYNKFLFSGSYGISKESRVISVNAGITF
jgi:hypothetical protein